MTILSLLLLGGLLSPECPVAAPNGDVAGAFTRASTRDSLVRIAVCVSVPASRRVGSYHGELTFEPGDARLVRIEKPSEGMRVENATVAGRVNFAAAVPAGLGSGMLLVVVLKSVRAGAVPRVKLCMLELNDTRGGSLLPPDSCRHP